LQQIILFSSRELDQWFQGFNVPICDSYESDSLENIEVGILFDVQNEVFLLGFIESGGFLDIYHEFDISLLKLCTFMNEMDNT
jgi:hypothetical protein